MKNFGWPCYEGPGRQSGYEAANLSICANLYGAVRGGNCALPCLPSQQPRSAERDVSDWQLFGGRTPVRIRRRPELLSRRVRWPAVLRRLLPRLHLGHGALTAPQPGQIRTFVAAAANPVNLETGPDGDLFYVDFDGGTIRRITYTSANQPPVAVATATPTTGPAPLTVNFNGSGSSDPDPGDHISYGWDLDGDGQFDDSTAPQPTYIYTAPGSYTAKLRVTDSHGASAIAAVAITAGNTAPRRLSKHLPLAPPGRWAT